MLTQLENTKEFLPANMVMRDYSHEEESITNPPSPNKGDGYQTKSAEHKDPVQDKNTKKEEKMWQEEPTQQIST